MHLLTMGKYFHEDADPMKNTMENNQIYKAASI